MPKDMDRAGTGDARPGPCEESGRNASPDKDAGPGPADGKSREQLLRRWQASFGHPAQKYLSIELMTRALAYEVQCREHGGLDARTRRALAAALAGRNGTRVALRTGVHLVREWNGVSYRVEVVEGGFHFHGRTHRSLTAIARIITGTNWSGPRFFGLTDRKGSVQGSLQGSGI